MIIYLSMVMSSIAAINTLDGCGGAFSLSFGANALIPHWCVKEMGMGNDTADTHHCVCDGIDNKNPVAD